VSFSAQMQLQGEAPACRFSIEVMYARVVVWLCARLLKAAALLMYKAGAADS